MTDTSTIEPWMTELWAWADKFEISEEKLPRNKEDLLEITDLNIGSNQLTYLPDSIGQLSNLELLNISGNQLTTLPECIVRLKKLVCLIIDEGSSTHSANKLINLPTEVTDFLRGLGDGCRGWNDPIKSTKPSNSIQEYIQRNRVSNKRQTVITENIDREGLQTVIDWAESCDLSIYEIPRDIGELANKTYISISEYTQPIPKAIGCLTQLRRLSLRESMSLGDNNCQADDRLPDTITNLVNLEELRLTCNDSDFIPTNLNELKSLKTLEIRFHDVSAIPKVLVEMSCDIKLHLSSKQDKLPDNLTDIRCLTELFIDDDRLTVLPDSIGALTQLQSLGLSCNSLTHLPETIIGLEQLTELTVWSESLTVLPDAISKLTSLKELQLDCKHLTYLPNSLECLKNLHELNIRSEHLSKLPNDIAELTGLKELHMACPSMKTLPSSIDRLQNLKTLLINFDNDGHVESYQGSRGEASTLSGQVTTLPESTGNLPSLEKLKIRSAYLDKLPDNIGSLKTLKELTITSHHLKQLPQTIGGLTSLTQLTLNCESLECLPEALGQLIQLEKLTIISDKIKKLPQTIGDLTSLTELTLNCEGLECLPESLGQLIRLDALTIASNEIKQLPKIIGDLTGLTKLTLSCEGIDCLPEALGKLVQLEGLSINSNKTKQFPKSLVNLTHLRSLRIPVQLIGLLPLSVIERYRNQELRLWGLPWTALYTPLAGDYSLSNYGFFLVDDGWDEKALIDLKHKTGVSLLFGLQTTDKGIDELGVIDGIIICQPAEVEQVIGVFKSVLERTGLVGISIDDFEMGCLSGKYARFIQANAMGEFDSDRAIEQIISQIPKGLSISSMMFEVESNRHISFEEFEVIETAIESRTAVDATVFYSSEIIDKPKYCWMGAIYAAS
jgi:Leucine-rich repeat (LRR) protein